MTLNFFQNSDSNISLHCHLRKTLVPEGLSLHSLKSNQVERYVTINFLLYRLDGQSGLFFNLQYWLSMYLCPELWKESMILWKFAPKNSIIDRPSCSNLVEDLFSADFISRDFIGSVVMKEGTRWNKIIHITNFPWFVLFFWFHLKFHSIEHNSINFIILLVQSRGIFHELTHLMAIPVVEFSRERYKIRKVFC